jgi:hypothetical protein
VTPEPPLHAASNAETDAAAMSLVYCT